MLWRKEIYQQNKQEKVHIEPNPVTCPLCLSHLNQTEWQIFQWQFLVKFPLMFHNDPISTSELT